MVKEQQIHSEITISSDLALYQALQRRTLAMDLTGLASYEVMRKWVDRLFALYAQAPAPGFQKVTQAQLLRADRQAFVRISEQVTGSLKSYAGARKPLDPLIEHLESDMTVTYFMLHIPAGHGRSGSSADKGDKDKKRPEPSAGVKGKRRDPVPQSLKGMRSRSPQGDAIGFGYNLVSCKQGSSCPRRHVCAVPGCCKAHPQTEYQ